VSVQDIFDPLKPVSSPAEWKAYQTMGANSDAAEVASMFVKTTTRKMSGHNSQLPGALRGAGDTPTVCHPFCNSTVGQTQSP
jgi:hypothetical protein